jgi:hypothetical protein
MTNRLLKNPAALLLQSNRTTYSGRGVLGCWMFAGALLATAPLHAQTGGIYVNSNNNVGIGTVKPISTLDVRGAISVGTPDYIAGISGSILQAQPTAGSGNCPIQLQAYTAGATEYGNISLNPSGGNVGIGTTNPSFKLDVNGAINDTGGALSYYLGGNLFAGYSGSTTNLYAQSNGLNIFDNTGASIRMMVNATGNVGIGTTSPTGHLTVQNGPVVVQGDSSSVWNYPAYYSSDTEPGGHTYAFGSRSGIGFSLSDETASAYRFVISNTGNVGINTASPGYMLDVAGQVHASSFVSSTTTYADFVFKPGYKLEPLSAVEASIQKDGHLPGIPSEAEAKAHGIDLASMQVKLLQKIEELTLHVISQEKRIEKLENENAALREKATK